MLWLVATLPASQATGFWMALVLLYVQVLPKIMRWPADFDSAIKGDGRDGMSGG